MKQIDKETMEIIGEMERQLQTFHGFRQLWAELVANRQQCGVSKEVLLEQQKSRLSALLGCAYTLVLKNDITWCGASKERDFIREIANEDCICEKTETHQGKCRSCRAKKVLRWPPEEIQY